MLIIIIIVVVVVVVVIIVVVDVALQAATHYRMLHWRTEKCEENKNETLGNGGTRVFFLFFFSGLRAKNDEQQRPRSIRAEDVSDECGD